MTKLSSCLLFLVVLLTACSKVSNIPVADGWAKNSVNTVVFRKNSLYTHNDTQYIGFYDDEAHLVIGKRKINSSEWELKTTKYKGNARDAHNSISIVVDGEGYLHVSWDHHNSPLRYVKSLKPGSLELSEELPMIGSLESVVSYPEFYKLPKGDLLFFYRDGGSGNGNLVINRFSLRNKSWSRVTNNLISGENQRNAYWQSTVDQSGTIHISWVWRESPDVASNHDMCYAKSEDGGSTWVNSRGIKYDLPITAGTAEYIREIPQNSELINQTSMTTDTQGNPMIVSYWKPEGSDVPQFHLIAYNGNSWSTYALGFRNQPFSLSGGGTKAIPISRPQIVTSENIVYMIFRDAERGNKVSVAYSSLKDPSGWKVTDLTEQGYEYWEPTYDPAIWMQKKELHLFLQDVSQIDGEGISNQSATPVSVLEWKP